MVKRIINIQSRRQRENAFGRALTLPRANYVMEAAIMTILGGSNWSVVFPVTPLVT